MTRVAWIDASVGAAGDMLVAALIDVGVAWEDIAGAIDAVGVPVAVGHQDEVVAGLRAVRFTTRALESQPPPRTWRDVRGLLAGAVLDERVRMLALDVFGRLARAEAAVHGVDAAEVHFHEVGAHDAVADVVGAAAGFVALAAQEVHVSPVALGGGWARSAHGHLPVPAPAVLTILRDARAPAYGGPVDVELCTPTGAAILAGVATRWGPLPPLRLQAVGVGAGTRRLPDRPNVVRLVVGEGLDASAGARSEEALVLSANVDDLDPRLWPDVLARLLDAGASDAWLTPILMKKGRPAHTLSMLVPPARADQVRRAVFSETSTIGLREQPVTKWALTRATLTVAVDGVEIRVKAAQLDGMVVNAQPEYDDVAAAAARLGRPVKGVLAAATAAAQASLSSLPSLPSPSSPSTPSS